jgi:glycerol-3-phosphate O-acyltransferase
MVVMPTGMVGLPLLAQSKATISLGKLNERVQRMFDALKRQDAPIAHSLLSGKWSIKDALDRFENSKLIQQLVLDGDTIIRIIPDRRITLEYYKNSVLHHMAPMSMMAAAIRATREQFQEGGRITLDSEAGQEVQRMFAAQVLLLRYEFTMDPDHDVQSLSAATLAQLQDYGAIHMDASGIGIAKREYLVEVAELTRNLLESAQLTLKGARALRTRDLTMDTMPKALQEIGEQMLAAEKLRRSEALSLVNLRNAVRAFRDEGLVRFRSDGTGLTLDEVAIAEHEADIGQLLR